ncbi:MAG: GIY-YIG nuclease family protein [Stellaceae bacterium]
MGGWVYILTNRRNGPLYVGSTVNLARRIWEPGGCSRWIHQAIRLNAVSLCRAAHKYAPRKTAGNEHKALVSRLGNSPDPPR